MAPSKKTLTPTPPTLRLADRRLVAGYEQLRHYALGSVTGEQPGPGFTLLLARGLRAWMEVCSQWLDLAPAVPKPEVSYRPPLPSALRAELVGLLTGMLLDRASRTIA